MTTDITSLSASQLSQAIRAGNISCVEVMQAYLQRIHRYNPVYNALVSLLDDGVLLAKAQLADTALARGDYWGWMHGMPFAVKDLADAKGLETSRGSKIFAGTVAEEDSLHIARIRAEGAIFIGKTNVPEFGLGSHSYNAVHGTTVNAYNPELAAGGSSGGAGVGLATHLLPSADGSDMMGSLRNPAGFNNVIGFRPSQGRVPSVPSDDLYYHQLSTNGPMGRTVEDTIRLLHTMSSYDVRFPLSLRDVLPPFEAYQMTELAGLRIGWLGDFAGYLATEPGLLDVCEQALSQLTTQGAIVEPCLPAFDLHRLWQTWLTLRHWALYAKRDLYEDPAKRALLKPEIVWEIESSFSLTVDQIAAATLGRADWYRAVEGLFAEYDLLALPSAQVFPFPAGEHWPKQINGRTMDTYHRWMEVTIMGTLAGLPVVCVPAGFDKQGRPIGIQFMGRAGQDQAVLEFAMAYESVTNYLARRPNAQSAIVNC